jgi:hypothetical protein
MKLTDQQIRTVLRARTLTWTGIAATFVLGALAMLAFPSGDEGVRGGYSFGHHFLSAMGKTRVNGSVSNTVSCLLFNGALVQVGIVLAVFWNARAVFLTRPAVRWAVRGCGLGMALAMAGIGCTPYDLLPRVHDPMTHTVVFFGVICFGLCLHWSPPGFESKKARIFWLGLLLAAGVAQGVFAALAARGAMPGRPALPLMQKLFVLLLAVWAGWQGVLFGRAARSGMKSP